MKICVYCGRENADTATHCIGCRTEGFRPVISGEVPSEVEADVSDHFVPPQLTDEEKQQALIILRTCRTLAEADLLVSVLEAAGVAAEIPDRALMEVFTCNVRVQVRTEQYDKAAQILSDYETGLSDKQQPANEMVSERAKLPLDLSMKCLLFLLPATMCPALVVGAWIRSHYAKQGYKTRADTVWLWLAAGFVFWLVVYMLFLRGRSR